MPLDTRIALGVQPLQVQFRDPIAGYNQLAQLQSADTQNQLAQMQMSAAQRTMQEEEGTKNFLSTNPDLSTPENQRRLLAFGKTGLAYGKAIAEQQKSKGEADKTAAEILGLNYKNFTAFNPPIRAAAGGIPGITDYVKRMYADPVLGTLAKKFKTEEQALKENLEMFTKDPDQWITAHSNLEGAQMLDALKMSAERAAERGRIASLPPRPAAAGAAVAPVAAAPTSIETIAPDLRISSAVIAEATNNPNSTAARMLSKMKEQPGLYKLDVAPNSYYDLAPDGQVVAKRMPDNQLAAAVAAAPVNAMAGNEATLQAIAAERKKLTDRLDVLDRLPFSKGVEREIKDKEARLKELNAPINLRADGTSIIPGMGALAAAPASSDLARLMSERAALVASGAALTDNRVVAYDNAITKASAPSAGQPSELTRLIAERAQAATSGASPQVLADYDAAIKKQSTFAPPMQVVMPVAIQDPKDPTKVIYVDRSQAIGQTPAAEVPKPLTAAQTQKLKTEKAADTAHVSTSQSTADELEKLANELVGSEDGKIKPHPGLGGITGYAAYLPSLPKGAARQAQQKLDTFKGKILALGRGIASQDGKLGNMAVQEWKFVSDAVQAIDPKAGNLDEQMRDVVRQAQAFAKRQKSKFESTYEDTGAAPSGRGVDTNNPLLK